MSYVADTHNFGQHVTRLDTASGVFFQKPRPVFWEWFFFGATSPLKKFYNNENLAPWFKLEVEFGEDSFNGRIKEVIANSDKSSPSCEELLKFGSLLAYSYIFGIRDLTSENVIRKNGYLQPIDVEVVLSNILLPQETFLLPYRDTPFRYSAFSLYFECAEDLDAEQSLQILKGFCHQFQFIVANLGALRKIFCEHKSIMAKIPIRYILHDTWKYNDWKTSKEEFLPEEIEQLQRGDIPYFYKFLGLPNIYCQNISEPTVVTGSERALKGILRAAVAPHTLLSEERLAKVLLPTGVLYLAKYLIQSLGIGTRYLGPNMILNTGANEMDIVFEGAKYVAKL